MMAIDRHILRARTKTTVEVLWPYILALCKDEAVYAYEIRQMIADRFKFEVGKVTAYMVLYKMESQGLVSAEWRQVENRQRKYYSITKVGRRSLEDAIDIFESAANALKG